MILGYQGRLACIRNGYTSTRKGDNGGFLLSIDSHSVHFNKPVAKIASISQGQAAKDEQL